MTFSTLTKSPTARILLRRSPQLRCQPPKRPHYNSTHSHPPSSSPKPADQQPTAIPVHNTVAAVPIWQRLGPLTRTFQAYGRSQRKRPYVTQFCTSLVIYFLGDASAQYIDGDEEYDIKRAGRALVISAGSSIPSYTWFMYLGTLFNYPSFLLSVTLKVALNQALFTPIFNTYFFGMQSLLSGDSLAEVWERIKRTVPISMVNSVKLWPAVTAFSFTFVEPQWRSLFAGVVAIGWQTYLSYLNRMAEKEEGEEKLEQGLEVAVKDSLKEVKEEATKAVVMRGERDGGKQKMEA